ncbi:tRNA-guanine(15) transglycosylase-like protein [Amylostereum chailletii]|nr:tRNA-guanine(15) transglycosylase-like protein [Amylostereum chailletii]
MSQNRHRSSLKISLLNPSDLPFVPRVGILSLHRHDEETSLDIPTPGFIASTSRGVVPHLSRDHTCDTDAIRWAHVAFESFLEHIPPVPTQYPGLHPLHKFLGFLPRKHVVSMTLRDPFDGREMPPNGTNFVSANCVRGVRKVTPADWRKYVLACDPDVVIALPDIPFTSTGYSQKRVTKSLERSTSWLADLLHPLASDDFPSSNDLPHLNVFLHMAGGVIPAARKAFSNSLLQTLHDKEAEAIHPFKTLDEGVCGYTFDLVPLHRTLSLQAQSSEASLLSAPSLGQATSEALDPTHNVPSPDTPSRIVDLLRASLALLPLSKPRLANSAGSPHEILVLIRDVGIDLFDAHWAQRAGDIGIALDFTFPTPAMDASSTTYVLGHNLYDTKYAHDFSPFSDAFSGAIRTADDVRPICLCIACSPAPPPLSSIIRHSKLDPEPSQRPAAPYTRAYIHHLLHTHEMSAHTFLVAHNLCVLDAFFAGIRRVLEERPQEFGSEVDRFLETYDGQMVLFGEARKAWAEVELTRGKGRLTREKEKQAEGTLGTVVEL